MRAHAARHHPTPASPAPDAFRRSSAWAAAFACPHPLSLRPPRCLSAARARLPPCRPRIGASSSCSGATAASPRGCGHSRRAASRSSTAGPPWPKCPPGEGGLAVAYQGPGRMRSGVLADGPATLPCAHWRAAPTLTHAPSGAPAAPCSPPEAQRLSAALKAEGFKFLGPTTCYALMQVLAGLPLCLSVQGSFRGPGRGAAA